MTTLYIAGALLVALPVVVVLAACRAAGLADERLERMFAGTDDDE